MFQVSTTTRRQRRGFTLHSLLCALALLILVVFVAPVAFFTKFSICTNENRERSRVDLLHKAVNLYVIHVGTCPTTKQGLDALLVAPTDLTNAKLWRGPYLDRQQLPLDSWASPYQYEANSDTEFRVWSLGRDGQNGTSDDIDSTL